jgi:hypothetical protein
MDRWLDLFGFRWLSRLFGWAEKLGSEAEPGGVTAKLGPDMEPDG